MIIGQISDLHVRESGKLAYGIVDAAAHLRRCVADVLALKQRPDLLVLTGDLVDCGLAGEYAVLRQILAPLTMPCYVIPGNHDQRAALRAAFADHAYLNQSGRFIQYAIDDWPVRIVALDTVVPGAERGEVCAERLAWLDARLSEAPDKPTVVIMHHPPFATGIGHMDRIGLAGTSALAAVISRHPQVERLLCGHLHRPIQVRFAGTLASTCPSPAHQVALDLAPDAPSCFMLEPPAYQLHAWRPGTGIVSHTAYVGRFEGPHPFRADGKLIR